MILYYMGVHLTIYKSYSPVHVYLPQSSWQLTSMSIIGDGSHLYRPVIYHCAARGNMCYKSHRALTTCLSQLCVVKLNTAHCLTLACL